MGELLGSRLEIHAQAEPLELSHEAANVRLGVVTLLEPVRAGNYSGVSFVR